MSAIVHMQLIILCCLIAKRVYFYMALTCDAFELSNIRTFSHNYKSIGNSRANDVEQLVNVYVSMLCLCLYIYLIIKYVCMHTFT